jgi:predicted nucleic acid-binding Zn ribbon protein
VAREDSKGPRPLASSLSQLAGRIRKFDLVGFAAIEAAWPRVEAAKASEAAPLTCSDGVLAISVPSGAHAARARRDSQRMLEELAALVADAPTSIRISVRPTSRQRER